MGDATKPDEDLVWKKEELQKQIRSLEHKIFIAQKQGGEDEKITDVLVHLKSAIQNIWDKKYTDAEKNVIDVKNEKNKIIHNLGQFRQITYFVSSWGLVPILTAIIAIILSFILMGYTVNILYIFSVTIPKDILGIVPLWAPLTAVIGASIQILVGVINDYKENSVISQYKRLWYFVLPVVGFVFGFIAFLLIQGGLININLGQVSLDQTKNISELPASLRGELPIRPTAFSIIICFLAGYATDWFMGLLGKLAPAK
jgi:hypothetical protein